ncbi:MAG: hypothetical protein ACHQPI_06605 [Thermoanaerobaculia bacterium]
MRRATWIIFFSGLLLQLLFVVRVWRAWPTYPLMRGSSIACDSIEYRGLMEDFLRDPRFMPSWKKSGTGADIPGCLLPLLLAPPAMATHEVRSSVVVVFLFHLAAGVLLMTTLRRAFGDRFTAVYLGVFWLSPWHLFHSGFVWEPNLLILPAAAHLWCCWVSRESARRDASFVLGAILVLTSQIHLSAMFLILLTGLLFWMRRLKISWLPFLAGAVAGSLPLLPAVIALSHGDPLNFSTASGFPGRGFLYVLPVLRAVQFWLRLGSLDVGRMYAGDCVSCVQAATGGDVTDTMLCLTYRLGGILASLSVLVTLAAMWWWFRRTREPDRPTPERWMSAYTWSALGALLLAAGLAPITLQTWHVVIAAPAACLPIAAWISSRWPFERRWVRVLVVAFLLARLPLVGLMAFDYGAFCLVPEPIARALRD